MKTENPNQELEEEIQTIFEENDENYGYRRIQLELKNKGITVNHKKVQRIMRKLGLKVEKFTRKSRRYSSYQGTVGDCCEEPYSSPFLHKYGLSKADNRHYRIQVFRWL